MHDNIEKSKAGDTLAVALSRASGAGGSASAGGVYTTECVGPDGKIKWSASSHNLVVNQGLQDMNAKYFTGTTYTATWFLGLYGAAASNNPVAGDTAATHAGFTEIVPYSNATRPACTFGTPTTADPSVATNSASPAAFNINATATVGGAFLISNNTKSGTTGVLFSASDFASPGDRTVASGDTLNVTYTFSLDAA
ncbi:MAG: hypothetical protein EHM12_11670 [Dehalococcoidia bacterium]|nr:MAG: hypothetical protein EHM12_11670 [Dehalococcoidia bacterium]